MERNKVNNSRGHGGRFRNQPMYNREQEEGGININREQLSSYSGQPQKNPYARRSLTAYQNPGRSQGPFGAQGNFTNSPNNYRGRGYGKFHPNSTQCGNSNGNMLSTNAYADADYPQPSLTGTCPDMCPAKERAQREKVRELAVFERLNGNPHKTSPNLAVKKFCRTISIADIQPSDIRPLPVLWATMKYLVELVDTSEHAFTVVHDFVFDRTRAIRQELNMQNIVGQQAINMHEQMVRFHILSQHKLHHLSSNKETPMLHLNLEQLSKCLKSLLDLYNDNIKSASETGCQDEFYSYYVLLNMRSCSVPQGESLSLWFRSVRPSLLKSTEMQFARNVLRCYRMGNFKGFFNLARKSTYLEACLMELYFNEVRAQAVACINCGSYKLSPFPMVDLAELLMMTESEMEDFCSLCGLATSTDDKGLKFLTVKQLNFSWPEKGFPWYSCPFIDGKLDSSHS